jgi:hypothetical protein
MSATRTAPQRHLNVHNQGCVTNIRHSVPIDVDVAVLMALGLVKWKYWCRKRSYINRHLIGMFDTSLLCNM